MADLGNSISLNASKFAAGVAETRAKLTELNTAFIENRKRMKELNDEAKKLQKQEQDLAKEMKDGGTAEQREQLQQLRDRMAQVNAEIGNLKTHEQELKHDISQTNRDLQEQREKAGDLSDAFSQLGQLFAGLGIAETCHQIAGAFGECVKAAEDFSATMSTVEALSGATASEMEKLSAKAKDLGATTKFTATESAQAMTFMGMAGWDAEQMLDGMSGMLDLAAASGSDLGLVADIVTDNLTAFGMKAEDTAHFADVLAAAATNSNTSVEIMGETFKNSASVAGALGYSIEDVSTAVGLMANAGVKGSIAGTSLKHTFEGLLKGVTLTSEAFGEVEVSAVKADGTMKSFGESVNELRGYFSKMSEAEKMLNAIEVAGKYGFNGLLAIVNSTQEDFDKLTGSINECEGAASKMAEVKMDNLSGQVTLMNSAMDALKNTLGSAYEDQLKALAKAATKVLTGINDFLSKHPLVTKAIVAITAAVTGLVAAFATFATVSTAVEMVKKFTATTKLATTAQAAFNAVANANPYVLLATAIAGVVTTVGLLATAEQSAVGAAKELREEAERIVETMNDSIATNDAEAEILRDKAALYEQLRNTENRTEIQERQLAALAGELQDLLGDNVTVVNELTGGYNSLSTAVEDYIATQNKRVKLSALEDAAKDAYKQIAEIDRQLQELYKEEQEKLANGIGFGADGFMAHKSAIANLESAKAELEKITKEYTDALEENYAVEEKAASGADDMAAANEKVTPTLDEIRKGSDDLAKSSEDLISQYSKAYESLEKLRNGEALNYEQMRALIKIHPELAKQIKATADGYTLETGAINTLGEVISESANAAVEAESIKTRALIEGTRDRIRAMEKEAEAAGMYEHDGQKVLAIGRKISEEAAYIEQLEAQLAVNKSLPQYFQSNQGKGSSSSSGSSSGRASSTPKEKEPPGLKSLMSYAKTTSAAFKEMNDNGELALTTVQALIDTGYGDALYKDGEKWKLSEKAFEEAWNTQIDAAKGVEGTTEVQRKALESFRGELSKVTAGLYETAKAEKELKSASAGDTAGSMKTLTAAVIEQKEDGGLSADTVSKLSGTRYAEALTVGVDAQITLDTSKLETILSDEIEDAIKQLESELATATDPDKIGGLKAQIQAFKNLKAVIGEVTEGLYGVEKAEEKLVSDAALKASEDMANRRLKQIDAELKAKQKLRDETLKAIDDEVQARKRLTEDNDIQRQIDQAMAQLKYSQLDEFSQAQLQRKIQSLQNDKADMLWERGIEDRRAAANEEYNTSAEQLNNEKENINNALEVLRSLNDTVDTGLTDLGETIKAAMEAVKPDSTVNLTMNNVDKMTADQLLKMITDLFGSTGAV